MVLSRTSGASTGACSRTSLQRASPWWAWSTRTTRMPIGGYASSASSTPPADAPAPTVADALRLAVAQVASVPAPGQALAESGALPVLGAPPA